MGLLEFVLAMAVFPLIRSRDMNDAAPNPADRVAFLPDFTKMEQDMQSFAPRRPPTIDDLVAEIAETEDRLSRMRADALARLDEEEQDAKIRADERAKMRAALQAVYEPETEGEGEK